MADSSLFLSKQQLQQAKQVLSCDKQLQFLTNHDWNGLKTKKQAVNLVICNDELLEFTLITAENRGVCLTKVPVNSLSFVKNVTDKFKFKLFSQHYKEGPEPAFKEYQVASLKDLLDMEKWIQTNIQESLAKLEPLQPWHEISGIVKPPTPSHSTQRDFVESLLCQPENHSCSECCTENPTWTSLVFGTLFCDRCAGAIRSLPPHLVRVKSLHLDTFDQEQRQFLQQRGNAISNQLLESNLTEKVIDSKVDTDTLHRWVRQKYLDLAYVHPDRMDEVATMFGLNGQLIEHVELIPVASIQEMEDLPPPSPPKPRKLAQESKPLFESEPKSPYAQQLFSQPIVSPSQLSPGKPDPADYLTTLPAVDPTYLEEDWSSDEEEVVEQVVEQTEQAYDQNAPVVEYVAALPPLPPRRDTLPHGLPSGLSINTIDVAANKIKKPRARMVKDLSRVSQASSESSLVHPAVPELEKQNSDWATPTVKLRPKKMESIKSMTSLPTAQPERPPTPPMAKMRPGVVMSPVKTVSSQASMENVTGNGIGNVEVKQEVPIRPVRQKSIDAGVKKTLVKPREVVVMEKKPSVVVEAKLDVKVEEKVVEKVVEKPIQEDKPLEKKSSVVQIETAPLLENKQVQIKAPGRFMDIVTPESSTIASATTQSPKKDVEVEKITKEIGKLSLPAVFQDPPKEQVKSPISVKEPDSAKIKSMLSVFESKPLENNVAVVNPTPEPSKEVFVSKVQFIELKQEVKEQTVSANPPSAFKAKLSMFEQAAKSPTSPVEKEVKEVVIPKPQVVAPKVESISTPEEAPKVAEKEAELPAVLKKLQQTKLQVAEEKAEEQLDKSPASTNSSPATIVDSVLPSFSERMAMFAGKTEGVKQEANVNLPPLPKSSGNINSLKSKFETQA